MASRTSTEQAATAKVADATPFVPYQRRWRSAREDAYVQEALNDERRQGGGRFTKACHAMLGARMGAPVLLTQSCTAALEFAAALIGVREGDEVIVPSYTFTSTATAFAMRGARIAFVDVDPRTQNLDPQWLEGAITPSTKAIVAMHYSGVACDMPAIEAIAARHNIPIIEDAAQAIGAYAPDGRALGAIGAFGCFSFHDTKNVSSGEGGALVVGDPALAERAEILWEKGTNRSAFLRGEVDKYTWVDLGSSFLPSEVTAAMLAAQLEETDEINAARLVIWEAYQAAFAALAGKGLVGVPFVPERARHNAHLYYLILQSADQRDAYIAHMRACGVQVVFHYVPLHDSPAGRRFGREASPMANSFRAGAQLIRLPLWPGMAAAEMSRTIEATLEFFA